MMKVTTLALLSLISFSGNTYANPTSQQVRQNAHRSSLKYAISGVAGCFLACANGYLERSSDLCFSGHQQRMLQDITFCGYSALGLSIALAKGNKDALYPLIAVCAAAMTTGLMAQADAAHCQTLLCD